MKRLYGLYDCDVCQNASGLGWVYICTQDDPNPELYSVNPTRFQTEKDPYKITLGSSSSDDHNDSQEPSPELSLWIQKAVNAGLYTTEQVQILIEQKKNVLNRANAVNKGPESAKPPTDSGKKPITSSPLKSIIDIEVRALLSNPTIIPGPPQNIQSESVQGGNAVPICRFRSCQGCRPTFRDRTWQRFDDVFEKDAASTLAAEEQGTFQRRPIGRASVVRNIGLRSQVPTPSVSRGRSRHRASGGSSESRDHGDSRSKRNGSEVADADLMASEDIVDVLLGRKSGSDTGHHQNKSESAPPRLDGAPLAKQTRLDLHFEMEGHRTICPGEDEEEVEGDESSSSSSAETSEDLNMDGGTSPEVGDVSMGDGVAVKEESVDLGMPDIIMSI